VRQGYEVQGNVYGISGAARAFNFSSFLKLSYESMVRIRNIVKLENQLSYVLAMIGCRTAVPQVPPRTGENGESG
jgi:hypothetical protein